MSGKAGKTGKERAIERYLEEGLLALVPFYGEEGNGTTAHTLRGEYRDHRGVSWLVQRLATHFDLDLGELRRRCGQLLGLRHHVSLPLSATLVLLPVRTRRSHALGETTTGYVNLLQVEKILPVTVGSATGQGQGQETGQEGGSRKKGKGGKTPGEIDLPAEKKETASPAEEQVARREDTAEKTGAFPGRMEMNWKEEGGGSGKRGGAGNEDGGGKPYANNGFPASKGKRAHPGEKEDELFSSPCLSLVLFKSGLQLETLNTPETLEERLRQGERVRSDFLARRDSGPPYPGVRLQDLISLLPPCECALKDYFLRGFHNGGG